ncbi:MAG TPA: phosphoribosylglycinamide synthetase [Nitrospinae bacterium]|nr:phosphoribosylglycinamide synthetase [Nitrospinota bacterium]
MSPSPTKRVLLLMTTNTYRASAYLRAAERAGVSAVVGTDRPDVLAGMNPGASLTLDFHEPEKAAADIARFAKEFSIDAVVAVDDDAVIAGAMAAGAMGLPAHTVEAARATRSKYELRKILDEEGLPSPGFRLMAANDDPAALAASVNYPCVLKPTFLAGSQGVIRANDEEEFAAAYRRIGKILDDAGTKERGGAESGSILTEDYVPGREAALEGLAAGGRLHVLAIFDKPDPMEGPFFEETIYVTPSRLPEKIQEEIVRVTERAARAIGLKDGPVHAEVRVNDGGVWVIDVASRTIGGNCAAALEFGDGASLEELILANALELEPPSLTRESPASGVMMIPIPGRGILRGVEGMDAALAVPGIRSIDIGIHAGGAVVPLPEGNRYLGFIFARRETPGEAEEALRRAHEHLRFRIDSEGAV